MELDESKKEELKKRLIVSPGHYDSTKLENQLEQLLQLCNVDEKGRVIIHKKDLTYRDKVKLIVIARFLAHKLDEHINQEVTSREIAENLDIRKEAARARISEAKGDGHIMTKVPGKYVAAPYKIQDFFDDLMKSRR